MFEVEQPTIQRIKDLVLIPQGLKRVGTVSSLAGVQDLGPYLPGVFIMPDRSEVGELGDSATQAEKQLWQVVVCVAHSEDIDDEGIDTTAQRAGAILRATAEALIGWRPAKGYFKFAYRGRPEPYYEPGYGEFPALFETGFLITGS